jgi:lipoprotein
MKEVVSCILNIVVACLVAFLLNLHLVEKKRYRALKKLNAQLDILLKAAELKNKGVPIPNHIQRYIRELYKTTEEK